MTERKRLNRQVLHALVSGRTDAYTVKQGPLLQNYQVALEQLEKLQHEKSLHMETPAGELREQVNSLSSTVATLTAKNQQLEETAIVSNRKVHQLAEEKLKLQCAHEICFMNALLLDTHPSSV